MNCTNCYFFKIVLLQAMVMVSVVNAMQLDKEQSARLCRAVELDSLQDVQAVVDDCKSKGQIKALNGTRAQFNPLYYAALNGYYDFAKKLLKLGLNPEEIVYPSSMSIVDDIKDRGYNLPAYKDQVEKHKSMIALLQKHIISKDAAIREKRLLKKKLISKYPAPQKSRKFLE